MRWLKVLIGCLIFLAVERFCYFQTGTFSLSKMLYENSPPSPTELSSPIELTQPLRWIGAGKQFYAFETADGKYIVKFLKWSRRRPLPWLENVPFLTSYLQARKKRAPFILESCQLALKKLPHESCLVIPQPQNTFVLIDKLGIAHIIKASSTHFYVQHKATPFMDAYQSGSKAHLRSFIKTVAAQCKKNIRNLDPVVTRNFGIIGPEVMLLDVGSFKYSPEINSRAKEQFEIVLELLPLRSFLQKHYPEDVQLFDILLTEELD